jgi:antitoxin MazE
MKVARWGNSLAIRLPGGLVAALDLKEGDDIEVDAVGNRQFEVRREADARALLARLRKYRGQIPADFKFDRLEANERV